MSDLLSQLGEILQWIGDSPFRLFSSLCLFFACIAYLFFKDQGPRYRAFVLVLLFLGVAGIGYSLLYVGDTTSAGLKRVQQAITNSVPHARSNGCMEHYGAVVASIAASNLDDIDIQIANGIIQDAIKTAKLAEPSLMAASLMGCQGYSIPGRGVIPKCQAGADALRQITGNIMEGDLAVARRNANLAERIFNTCGLVK